MVLQAAFKMWPDLNSQGGEGCEETNVTMGFLLLSDEVTERVWTDLPRCLGLTLKSGLSGVCYKRPHSPSPAHHGLCPRAVLPPGFFSSQPALEWPLGSFRDPPLGNSPQKASLLSGLASDYGGRRRGAPWG